MSNETCCAIFKPRRNSKLASRPCIDMFSIPFRLNKIQTRLTVPSELQNNKSSTTPQIVSSTLHVLMIRRQGETFNNWLGFRLVFVFISLECLKQFWGRHWFSLVFVMSIAIAITPKYGLGVVFMNFRGAGNICVITHLFETNYSVSQSPQYLSCMSVMVGLNMYD